MSFNFGKFMEDNGLASLGKKIQQLPPKPKMTAHEVMSGPAELHEPPALGWGEVDTSDGPDVSAVAPEQPYSDRKSTEVNLSDYGQVGEYFRRRLFSVFRWARRGVTHRDINSVQMHEKYLYTLGYLEGVLAMTEKLKTKGGPETTLEVLHFWSMVLVAWAGNESGRSYRSNRPLAGPGLDLTKLNPEDENARDQAI